MIRRTGLHKNVSCYVQKYDLGKKKKPSQVQHLTRKENTMLVFCCIKNLYNIHRRYNDDKIVTQKYIYKYKYNKKSFEEDNFPNKLYSKPQPMIISPDSQRGNFRRFIDKHPRYSDSNDLKVPPLNRAQYDVTTRAPIHPSEFSTN